MITTTSRNVSVTAVELFTYLNFCPNKAFKLISNFFENLIKTESEKNILLALASMMKTSENISQESSTRIFIKTMEKMKLHHYKDIDIITKTNGFNDCAKNSNHCNETFKTLGTLNSLL